MPQSLQLLKKIGYTIDALSQFKNRKTSLFNVSKLANILHLSEVEMNEILTIILKLQTQFSNAFDNYRLQKLWKNGTIYLTLVPKGKPNPSLKQIELNNHYSQLVSDIIYYFQHVKIGKGFNVHANGTDLSRKVKNLYKTHPYFFESRGNGLIYPSQLALEIGKQLQSYNKSNRDVPTLHIGEYLIRIR